MDYKQLNNIENYKLYYDRLNRLVELLIKFHGFYLFVTSSILSFNYSTFASDNLLLRFSLLIPVMIGFILVWFFIAEFNQFKTTQKSIDEQAEFLEIKNPPNVDTIKRFLFVSVVVYFLIILLLLVAFFVSFFNYFFK